jgi:hypothetical protein
VPLQRLKKKRSTNHRALPSRLRSAYRISHPLDGLLPLQLSQPCFMLGTLMGFHPSEPCPLNEVVAPLDARSPHAVVNSTPNVTLNSRPIAASLASRFGVPPTRIQRLVMGRSTSGYSTSPESVSHDIGRSHAASALLSWAFTPLQGLAPTRPSSVVSDLRISHELYPGTPSTPLTCRDAARDSAGSPESIDPVAAPASLEAELPS